MRREQVTVKARARNIIMSKKTTPRYLSILYNETALDCFLSAERHQAALAKAASFVTPKDRIKMEHGSFNYSPVFALEDSIEVNEVFSLPVKHFQSEMLKSGIFFGRSLEGALGDERSGFIIVANIILTMMALLGCLTLSLFTKKLCYSAPQFDV